MCGSVSGSKESYDWTGFWLPFIFDWTRQKGGLLVFMCMGRGGGGGRSGRFERRLVFVHGCVPCGAGRTEEGPFYSRNCRQLLIAGQRGDTLDDGFVSLCSFYLLSTCFLLASLACFLGLKLSRYPPAPDSFLSLLSLSLSPYFYLFPSPSVCLSTPLSHSLDLETLLTVLAKSGLRIQPSGRVQFVFKGNVIAKGERESSTEERQTDREKERGFPTPTYQFALRIATLLLSPHFFVVPIHPFLCNLSLWTANRLTYVYLYTVHT